MNQAVAGILKADPAAPSPFVEHPKALAHDTQVPFNKIYRNPSPQAWARARGFNKIVIMPVNIRYFQGSKGATTQEQLQRARVMAEYMHTSLEKSFAKESKYQVVSHPGRKTLVLEVALVQLYPTNVPINVVATGAGAVVPGATFVGSIFSRGHLAMEGKLRNGENGELLEEFTDREHDKGSLFSFRDFSAYAHSRRAADDWAKELAELSRTPRGQKVHGALGFTLNPL